jgi:ribosomal-protein-alanine N-acetyltransferase
MLTTLLQSGELQVPKANRTFLYRRMVLQDLEQICQLENQLFRSAWSEEMFSDDLDQNYAISLVVLEHDIIVAYIVLYTVLDELHVANLGVAPEYQRLGIGYSLLQDILCTARSCSYAFAHLEVRKSNLPAISLYERLGFEKVGLRKNYYEEEQEDAILMSNLLQVTSKLNPANPACKC